MKTTEKPKNIAVCFDGTGNEYGDNKTNVVRICEIATADDSQLVFYDPGVGTGGWDYDQSKGDVKAKRDKATGRGLQDNVEDGYRFLMENYRQGDRVFIFGFSRGAFTARSLGGMLYRCGLLRPGLDNLVKHASEVYNRKNDGLDAGFKATFSRTCPVHFVGVWDTVKSLTLHEGKKFHDARLNPEIKNAYHAIALDEMRKDFPPCLWDEKNISDGQMVEQVWFAGVHSDVGGWYDEHELSDISLRWMLEKAEACGLLLDSDKFSKVQGDPDGEMHDSYEWPWHLRGKHKRQVPSGAKVHKSVQKRMKGPLGYNPVLPLPNNVDYVE